MTAAAFSSATPAPDVTYRLQRAASVTGTWTNLATNTAPASGLMESHDTSPLPRQAFYRTRAAVMDLLHFYCTDS